MRNKPRAALRLAVPFAIALGVFALSVRVTQAHKAVTSKYDYNKDVFPILRDRCASCHTAGGPAPMSLMTYNDAVMWAESIREELSAQRMPPWPVDPLSPAVKGGHPITAKDIDMIVTWASGGTPRGDLTKVLPSVVYDAQWKLGAPDLKIAMDSPHTVAAGTVDETCDFSLPTGLTEAKWVRAVDLMPGTATMVRDAMISIENGPTLAEWEPGGDTIAAPSGAAFKLAAGATIHLQIHYKKHYLDEQSPVSDRSTIGLYFTDPPPSGREIQSLSLDAPQAAGAAITAHVAGAARILALRPMLDQPYESVQIAAVTPTGTRISLLKLHAARPQWFRRYWLQDSVEIPAGSTIEATLVPLAVNSDEPRTTKRFPLQISLDYVPQ
jgi:hypothetical protein